MNFNNFDSYYKVANEAKNKGDFQKAHIFYMRAGKALLELALIVEGDLKRALIDRADRLITFAKVLQSNVTSTKSPSTADTSNTKIERISSPTDNSTTRFIAVEIPNTSFDDVAGMENVKKTIQRRVINPIKHMQVYEKFKKKTGGGILMYGYPGTGKTMIAKAIANEVGAKFYSIRCSDIVSKWFGEAEKNIKELFDTARKENNAVIFFDEFESLSAKREGDSSVMPRIVAELLSQIQGFIESKNTLLLLAATNRPWDIDSAFLRPGRFDEFIYIDLPDLEARKYILTKKFDDIPIECGIDFKDIALKIEGFSGADVEEFCDRCKDYAVERCMQNNGNTDGQMVEKEDINITLGNFKSSVQQKELEKLKTFNEQYHADY